MSDSATSTPRRAGIALALLAMVVLGIGLLSRQPGERTSNSKSPRGEPEQRRLRVVDPPPPGPWPVPAGKGLAGHLVPDLVPGFSKGGYEVTGVERPKPEGGDLAVRFESGGAVVYIYIARRGTTKFNPPLSTEKHDLFIGINGSAKASPDAMKPTELLEVVAERVRKHEADVPENLYVEGPPSELMAR